MGTFGDRLRRERELRGVTLEEIAEATKIGSRSLRALEQEDFGKLPGGIFNKGFVRSYARFLGISEEQAVADYEAALTAQSPEQPDPIAAVANWEPSPKIEPSRRQSGVLWSAVAILVVALLGFGAWRLTERYFGPARQPVATAQPRAQTPEPGKIQPSAGEIKPAAAPAPAAKAGPAPFTVRIRAKQPTWVSISADGKLFEGTLAADSERLVEAQEKIVFKTGNAGGVEVSHNGRPLPPLGEAGRTRTLTFTSEGIQQ